jgi:hypothetical protein
MKKALLVLIAIVSYQSTAQVFHHGSVVVLNFTNEKLIVAADSRQVTDNTKPPKDNDCKLSQFGHKMIFASTGATSVEKHFPNGLVSRWTNAEAAKQALVSTTLKGKGPIDLKTVGTHWAKTIGGNWLALYPEFSQQVKEVAEEGNGTITVGFFALANRGKIEWKLVLINFDVAKNPAVYAVFGDLSAGCWSCGQTNDRRICAGGQPSIAKQVCSEFDSRKHPPNIAIDKGLTLREQLPIWLVKMTAACDLTETVGGAVDVLELTNGGKIHWLRRKKNCPKNVD